MRILRIRIRNTANIRREGLESVAAGLEGQTDKTQVEDIFSSNADPNYKKKFCSGCNTLLTRIRILQLLKQTKKISFLKKLKS